MARTITALFDTRPDAEAGRQRLIEACIGADNVNIHDRSSPGYSENDYSTHESRGLWDSIKHAFLPDEDRHTYEEGLRRGGYLLTADVEDAEVDRAVAALEQANGVDIEQRAADWRAKGWSYPGAADSIGAAVTAGAPAVEGLWRQREARGPWRTGRGGHPGGRGKAGGRQARGRSRRGAGALLRHRDAGARSESVCATSGCGSSAGRWISRSRPPRATPSVNARSK